MQGVNHDTFYENDQKVFGSNVPNCLIIPNLQQMKQFPFLVIGVIFPKNLYRSGRSLY